MAEQVFLSITVKQDRQARRRFTPLDSAGAAAEVDNGYEFDSVADGAAEVAVDPADTTGLTVVYKSDLSATTFPAVSIIKGHLDADLGDGVEPIELIATVTTIPKQAVTAGVEDLGDEPRA